VTGTTVRASVRAGGQQAKLGAGGGELSADGRVVAFTSFEGHLVRNDHNGVSDAFVRVLGGP
jgi:TolB protein